MANPWDMDAVAAPWEADAQAMIAKPSNPAPQSSVMAVKPVPHTGYAAQVANAFANPAQPVQPKSAAELAQNWGSVGKGAVEGVPSGLAGIPGDIEALGRLPLSKMTSSVSPENQMFPTSSQAGNLMFGQPADQYEAGGRTIGNMLSTPMALKGTSLMRGAQTASDAASAARAAGFKIPPNMASENPSLTSQTLSALGGKIKMQQLASTKNADVTTSLAARDLGLPEDEPITETALEGVRMKAGKAYDAVRKAPIQIFPDAQFHGDLGTLNSAGASARAEVPELVSNPEIDNIVDTLGKKQQFSPDASVDLIRSLRYKAQTNLKNYTSPEKMDLGRAQSSAANAVETLVERNLQAATTARAPIGAQGGNMSGLVDDLKTARTTIAKSYDIQNALNPATGQLDAQKIAALAAKGKPLTGGLKQIADTAAAFPKAMQSTARFGGNENTSVLDAAIGLHGAMTGNPKAMAEAMGWIAGRPAARQFLLSDFYQNRAIPPLGIPQPQSGLGAALTNRRALALTAPQLAPMLAPQGAQ